MEVATGGERTVDGIADGERIVLGHPKTRESMRAGLAMYFVTLADDGLMEIADRIVRELEIEWFLNIQLVGDHVIEVNPRISTIVYQEDLNLPWLGVKRALGEISDDELAQCAPRPPGDRASILRSGRTPRPDGAALLRLRSSSTRDASAGVEHPRRPGDAATALSISRTAPTATASIHDDREVHELRIETRGRVLVRRATSRAQGGGHRDDARQVTRTRGSAHKRTLRPEAPSKPIGRRRIKVRVPIPWRPCRRSASPTAPSTPPESRGRTCRRCAPAASTRGSSSSTATASIPRPTSTSSGTAASSGSS